MTLYEKHRRGHLARLAKLGWTLSKPYKIPYATSPDGEIRLWFKKYAVLMTTKAPGFSPHQICGGWSLHLDMRALSTEEIIAQAEESAQGMEACG